jgi:DNA-binding IclR family transcriptional regulator
VTAAVKLHKSTAHRFLMVMRAAGLLERSQKGLWRIGPKFDGWCELRALRGGAQ